MTPVAWAKPTRVNGRMPALLRPTSAATRPRAPTTSPVKPLAGLGELRGLAPSRP